MRVRARGVEVGVRVVGEGQERGSVCSSCFVVFCLSHLLVIQGYESILGKVVVLCFFVLFSVLQSWFAFPIPHPMSPPEVLSSDLLASSFATTTIFTLLLLFI